jgi:peptide/nickel transport system permease protein
MGVVAAALRGSLLDRAILLTTSMGLAFPPFYLGMLLIITFSLKLHLLPSGGMFPVTGDPSWGNVGVHLILPAIALAGGPLTVVARIVRTSALEILRKDYVRTAHAKGLTPNFVVRRHVFVNAIIPVMSLLGLQVGYLLSATALVEVVFSWPGLGSLIVQSILTRDFPLTQGGVLLIALMYVSVNTLFDLFQLVLDPRIKYG